VSPATAEKTTNGARNGTQPVRMANGRRVLLVEDEALVAMMIEEFLTESGHSVVGPIASLSEAALVAKDGDFDAAILDINLGGGVAYSVAETLSARGVPFIFVTGYEADTIDDRFSEVPILQKPIERQALQQLFVPGAAAARDAGLGTKAGFGAKEDLGATARARA